MSEEIGVDRMIEELLTGTRRIEDPEVRRWLSAHPEAERRLDDLRDLADLLEHAGREARETLEGAGEAEEAPGRERVAPHLAKLVRERRIAPASELREGDVPARPAHPSRPRRLPPILAAAAVLLVLLPVAWYALRERGEPNGTTPVYLGEGSLEARAETDPATGAPRLAWSYELSPGGWFSLEVEDPSAAPGADPIASLPRYTDHAWTPDEKLPATVRVRILARDAAGEVEGSWSGEVSFSP